MLRAAAPVAALALLAAPAAANAQAPATLVPGTQCIRFLDSSLKTFPLQGAGFTPGSAVTILSDGAPLDTVTADAGGSFATPVFAPFLTTTRKNVAITATDNMGHDAGPLALPEVKLTVEWPNSVHGNKRVLFRAYGFPEAGKNVYLHIRRSGQNKGTFKLGKADSPCGLTKKRMHYIPLSHYSSGVYDYWFDQHPKYNRATALLHYRVTITRGLRAASAAAHSMTLAG